jgi:hypothetical protein
MPVRIGPALRDLLPQLGPLLTATSITTRAEPRVGRPSGRLTRRVGSIAEGSHLDQR